MIDTNRSRLRPDIDSPMLSICTAPACTAIVFGDGTCVAHDQPRPHPADMALGNAVSRGQVSLTVEARQPAAIES